MPFLTAGMDNGGVLYLIAEEADLPIGVSVTRKSALPPGVACVLSVLEDNRPARQFYENHGFQDTGHRLNVTLGSHSRLRRHAKAFGPADGFPVKLPADRLTAALQTAPASANPV